MSYSPETTQPNLWSWVETTQPYTADNSNLFFADVNGVNASTG